MGSLHENRNPPTVLPDSEYPDWVWGLVPESRRYWWTDLVQTPFENLSEVAHFGSLGKVRPHYNDPWPKPITKMDIPAFQKEDKHWKEARDWVRAYNLKNKKRLESDSD